MMFEFEIDGSFRGREDDLNFMFCPGNFVNVGCILLSVKIVKLITFRMNWSRNA